MSEPSFHTFTLGTRWSLRGGSTMYVVVTEPRSSDDNPVAVLLCEPTGSPVIVGSRPERPAHWVPWGDAIDCEFDEGPEVRLVNEMAGALCVRRVRLDDDPFCPTDGPTQKHWCWPCRARAVLAVT